MTTLEIFSAIEDLQLKTLMFHEEQADMFQFMSLPGFKKIHKKMAEKIQKEFRENRDMCVDVTNRLPKIPENSKTNSIPPAFYSAATYEVNADDRKKYIAESFTNWWNWQKELKKKYQEYQKMLFDMGETYLAKKVWHITHSTIKTLRKLEDLVFELKYVDFAPHHVEIIQGKVCKKFFN